MSVLQSIPSPTKIRDELEQMVLKELLGRAGTPESLSRLPGPPRDQSRIGVAS